MIEARNYAQAKRIYDAARDKASIPREPIYDLVKAIEFGLVQGEIDGRQTDD